MATQKRPNPDIVKIGMHVEIELLDQHGRSERLSLDIVDDAAADFDAGLLGAGTLLARAIIGQSEGRKIPYRVGDLVAVQILAVSASQVMPDVDRANKRNAVIKKALSDTERTNAFLFASSFSGKWGDYDPDGIENWDQDETSEADSTNEE